MMIILCLSLISAVYQIQEYQSLLYLALVMIAGRIRAVLSQLSWFIETLTKPQVLTKV